jgi:hypothetical protein
MNEKKHRVNNKVVITVEGGIADIRHFPLDISVCINDLDNDSVDKVIRNVNGPSSLAIRWEYLVKRVDHDCDLICRLTIKKILEVFPDYFDLNWREMCAPDELIISGHNEWWFGDTGLRLCRKDRDITFDDLETIDSFEFVQALMMDHELLLEELSKYGENYRKSGLVG